MICKVNLCKLDLLSDLYLYYSSECTADIPQTAALSESKARVSSETVVVSKQNDKSKDNSEPVEDEATQVLSTRVCGSPAIDG